MITRLGVSVNYTSLVSHDIILDAKVKISPTQTKTTFYQDFIVGIDEKQKLVISS